MTKYGYKLLISVVGLGFLNYVVLRKIDFFYFLETFILGPLFQLDCCHLVLTRHDTLSQSDVFTQNSIMRAIIEVSGCNQTHPKFFSFFSLSSSLLGLPFYSAASRHFNYYRDQLPVIS